MKKKSQYTYVDLFCGAGGFSVGFDEAGFTNIFSLDNDKGFCKTYRRNFPKHNLIEQDITNITARDLKKLISSKGVDVVVGGPPCQGFSIAGGIGRKFIDDPRNHLFKEFVRVVSIIKPRYFIMENVARLFTHNHGTTKQEIIDSFKKIGYSTEVAVLNTADFGVPQVRRRVVFIGSRFKQKLTMPDTTTNQHRTVEEAISDLPKLLSGEEDQKVPNHKAMVHTDQMLKKMSYVTEHGGREEIPKKLRPQSGDARKYIRYKRNKPSVTVTGDMRKIFHYEQNRALTVRELARLQSFSDKFIFEDNVISQQQQVGNAVPPLLAKALAKHVKALLNKYAS